MSPAFVSVQVEEHEALPDGCSLRFRAQAEGRRVMHVRYESESGSEGVWIVRGHALDGSEVPAIATPVDDSSAGTSVLISGGEHGLRLTSLSTGETIAEAYLLVSPASVVD